MSTTIQIDRKAKAGLGGEAYAALAITVFIWIATIAFVMLQNQYLSFALAGAMGLIAWSLRRWFPQHFSTICAALSQRKDIVAIVSIAVLLALPWLFKDNSYWIHIFTTIFIFGLVAQGLNIHLGEIGAINVGYAGFFAVGAYASAILIADQGANFWVTLLYATAICWLVGLMLGACTIRTTGDYLSLVTLGFGFVVYQLAVNMTWLTHGTDGIHVPKPTLLGHQFDRPLDLGLFELPREANFYYLSLLCLIVAMMVSYRVTQSWIGRTWAAMRQDRVSASCFGINVPVMQMFSFAFGASFAGVAGAIYASEIGFIEPREFTIFFSITVICMVILGGMGNWWGVVLGAFIMIVVPEKLREFQELRYFLYGLVLLVILINRPYGLFPSPARKHEKIMN